MAEVIDAFPDRPSKKYSAYPFDLWFDGRIWKLSKGADFESDHFKGFAYAAAKERGGRAKIHKVSDDVIILQFIKANDIQDGNDTENDDAF